jgi:hypothetical protein
MGSSPGPNTVYLYADEALGYASSDPQHPAFLALKAPQAPQRTWRIWSEAYGGGASISGALPLGTAPLTFAGGGGAFGADYLANPDTIVGFAVGGGTSGFDVADRLTSGQVNSAHFAAYAAERWGPLYATGILGYNAFYNTEKRSVSIPGSTCRSFLFPVWRTTFKIRSQVSQSAVGLKWGGGFLSISSPLRRLARCNSTFGICKVQRRAELMAGPTTSD